MVNVRDKRTALAALKQTIIDQNTCSELARQANQLVFGSGNPGAEVLFIGEAPGKQEDLQGEPFVGAAGKLLDEMLASVSLQRPDVYITNIVKYRPPDNRDPLPTEIQAFLPFLQAQIKAVDPKLIVTLGRHSMEYFLPGKRISQVHGKRQQVYAQLADTTDVPRTILPLYHPAAALYNGGLRQTLFNDFAMIPAIITSLKNDFNEKEEII